MTQENTESSLTKMYHYCLIGAATIILIHSPAIGFEIYNESPYSIRATVPAGDFDEVIPPGEMRACHYSNTGCNPSGSQNESLTLIVETLDSNDQDFKATVEMLAGAQAFVHRSLRSEMGLEPLLYVDSWNIPGDALIDNTRLGTNEAERSIRFLATADCQYQHPGTTASTTDWPVANATNARMKDMAEIDTNRIRGIIYAGDLTQNARRDEWEQYKSQIGSIGEFLYDGMGNHDLANDRPCGITSPAGCTIRDEIAETIRNRKHRTTKTNKAPGDDPHYSWDWHDVHFVQLNLFPGNAPSPGRPEDDSGTTLDPADALSFLIDDLAQHVGSSGRPVVLVHHYGFDGFSIDDDWWTAAERGAYWDAISNYNVIGIFTGHQHLAEASLDWRFDFKRPNGAAGPGLIPTFVTGGAINGVFLDVEINDDDEMIVTRRFNDGRELDQQFVAFGPDDFIDDESSNDACLERFDLGGVTDISVESLRVFGNDADWYGVSVPPNSTLTIDLSFLHQYGNIDIEVSTVCGLSPVASGDSTDDNETLSWTNTGSTIVDAKIRVFMASGEGSNTYDLDLSIGGDALEENDDCASPTNLGIGVHNGLSVEGDDEDWYRVTVPAASLLSVVMTQFDTFNDVKIEIWNGCDDNSPNPSQSNANMETATFNNDGPARDVWVRVYMVQQLGTSGYQLDISSSALDVGSCDDAELIAPGVPQFGHVYDAVDDWFAIPTEDNSLTTVVVEFTHADGDIDLELWNACHGTLLHFSASDNDNEAVSYEGNAFGELIFARVRMYDAVGENDYLLTVSHQSNISGHDNCEDATVISGSQDFIYDNHNATIDGAPHSLCNQFSFNTIDHDVWFDWTSDATGVATLSTCPFSETDSKVAVYEGSSCTGQILACNDDACGQNSEVSFDVLRGHVYKLRIGTYQNAATVNSRFRIHVEDEYAGNTSCSMAPELEPGAYDNFVIANGQQDWFKVEVPPNTRLTVNATDTAGIISSNDADFFVHRLGSGNCPGPAGIGTYQDISNGKRFFDDVGSESRTYYIELRLTNVLTINYNLEIIYTTIDDAFEPNNACDAPTTVGQGFYTDLRCADDDYYAVTIPETSILDVGAFFAQADGDLSLLLYGPCGQPLANSNTATDDESLSYVNTGPEKTVMIRIVQVTPTEIVPYAMDINITDIEDCNGNGIDDPIEIADQLSDDCNNNGKPDECDLATQSLLQNITSVEDAVWLGLPDDQWAGIGSNSVLYSFGSGARVVDGPGSDFNVYEADVGAAEFDKITVLVSSTNILNLVDITATESHVVRVPGDEQHGDDAFARSFDIAASGFDEINTIVIRGVGVAGPAGGSNGFDLDAVGAIYLAPAGCDVLFDGDLNCDGVVDLLDVSLFSVALVEPEEFPMYEPICPLQRADVNRDGKIDGSDTQGLVELLTVP